MPNAVGRIALEEPCSPKTPSLISVPEAAIEVEKHFSDSCDLPASLRALMRSKTVGSRKLGILGER